MPRVSNAEMNAAIVETVERKASDAEEDQSLEDKKIARISTAS